MKFPSLRLAAAACSLVVAATVAGCATGDDAVAQGGTFVFVSPGGKTELFYDPPSERGAVGKVSGEDLMTDGKTTSLTDYEGQVVVLNVWGQWCGPCRGEADDLEKVYENTKDMGVQFLGINVRDHTKDKAQDFVVNNKVGYPSIYDPEMRTLLTLGKNYPTSVIPTTIVLDREHRVAAVFLKELLVEDLQPVVERIAQEPQDQG
ncbi:redoxin domain-containing protein [Rhodococcus hoagii]|jgi:thiol-disulfide isomerase/thioredoxin|uniref:Antioxidant, AhpC/TSA family n=3 Tax=Rhodococcus hoagii TaxID=43767 RepID=E9SYV4_RHOHA|nr:TlpA disulfide reductase family protein [Prescottella equi]MBU4616004.1 TlpA family protein disulfide reductase [Rhodococcus sp. GG48]MCD7050578.1 TlpA family protein disulfide reductase [Rhodococcus sp. BH2-1]GBF16082.1 thiol-disulfide oxidoreductase ResA [Rhodococcus sp. Br-6]AVP69893.1 TlpA family protein disulfide reductase [Prescottella equi]EGD25052.1 antioxidant, AhpC/TSA family [Prescottella equi ATCC 33707]